MCVYKSIYGKTFRELLHCSKSNTTVHIRYYEYKNLYLPNLEKKNSIQSLIVYACVHRACRMEIMQIHNQL